MTVARCLMLIACQMGCSGSEAGPPAGHEWPVGEDGNSLAPVACEQATDLGPVDCATLEVPERWGESDGRRIILRVVVLRARSEHQDRTAVFMLAGGPGQAATELAEMIAAEHDGIREIRDIVLLDQRGTGGSRPLRCDTPDPEDTAAELRATATACLDRYRDSVDFRWYTTPHAAADLEAVRQALGYDRIDIDAGSYGTRLALVYMKRHPNRVRSAVLRGVSPTDYRNPLPFARAGQFALESLFAACATESACASAFPDLEGKFATVLRRLEEEPVVVSVPEEEGTSREIRIGRERFATQLHLLLFLPELAARIPYLLDRAHAGEFVPFAALAAAFDAAIESQIYWGMQLAVVCPEDLARIGEDDIARETSGTFLGESLIRDYQEICRVWPTAPLPTDYWEATASDVPTLLISGEIDPSTPPRFAEEAAKTLTRSRHVLIPGGTHIHRSACLDGVVEEFVREADTEGVDTSCLESHAPIPFFLGDEAG